MNSKRMRLRGTLRTHIHVSMARPVRLGLSTDAELQKCTDTKMCAFGYVYQEHYRLWTSDSDNK